jgi:hypothetical protein
MLGPRRKANLVECPLSPVPPCDSKHGGLLSRTLMGHLRHCTKVLSIGTCLIHGSLSGSFMVPQATPWYLVGVPPPHNRGLPSRASCAALSGAELSLISGPQHCKCGWIQVTASLLPRGLPRTLCLGKGVANWCLCVQKFHFLIFFLVHELNAPFLGHAICTSDYYNTIVKDMKTLNIEIWQEKKRLERLGLWFFVNKNSHEETSL